MAANAVRLANLTHIPPMPCGHPDNKLSRPPKNTGRERARVRANQTELGRNPTSISRWRMPSPQSSPEGPKGEEVVTRHWGQWPATVCLSPCC